jgi:hypothetical protein
VLFYFIKYIMYYLSKNYFYVFKIFFMFFTLLSIIFLIFSIFFPYEAFAMEPDTIIDYYGNKEYVGPDPYGHNNNNSAGIITTTPVLVNPDIIQVSHNDSYGTSAPYEKDWYAKNDPYIISPTIGNDNSIHTLFISLKRRTFWYVWKIHSDDYSNYKDFKCSWDPKNSIRKEILKDIKSRFNNLSTK